MGRKGGGEREKGIKGLEGGKKNRGNGMNERKGEELLVETEREKESWNKDGRS